MMPFLTRSRRPQCCSEDSEATEPDPAALSHSRIAGCSAPFINENSLAEFLCLACRPVLEIIRVLDIGPDPKLLDGHGQPLPLGEEPYWITAVLDPDSETKLTNSAGEAFSPTVLVLDERKELNSHDSV